MFDKEKKIWNYYFLFWKAEDMRSHVLYHTVTSQSNQMLFQPGSICAYSQYSTK